MVIWFILGTCLGSFYGVVAERLPKNISLVTPGSVCLQCQTPLTWKEKIPIASILVQRFTCRHCQKAIPYYYLTIELLSGLLFCWYGSAVFDYSFTALFYFIWLSMALLLALTDYFYYLVEPKIFYTMMLCLVGLSFITSGILYWQHPLIVLASGYLLAKLIPESFGGGDVLVITGWSCFLSAAELAYLLFYASLIGLFWFMIWHLQQKTAKELPFVPCLSLSLLFLLIQRFC